MELKADRVSEIFTDCLFKEGEDKTVRVEAKGLMFRVGFHPERLKSYEKEIVEMLEELPDSFHEGKGGGMSFLQACEDRHGNHWAEHQTMDKFFVLGIAIGRVKECMKSMRHVLPGGMPYFVFLKNQEKKQESL